VRTLSGATRLAAVIGSPIRHSLSPAIHNAAFAATGLDWAFVAFEVAPGAAAEALQGMRALGIEGLSVTMPHKADVAAAVDCCSDVAARLRSVNTVVRRDDGSLEGHNTDGDGLIASLRDAGVDVAGSKAVLIGAGGAGRSIALALGRCGAAEVAVVNRSADAAHFAAELAGASGRVAAAESVVDADLVVNATPVGMGANASFVPIDTSLLRRAQVVVDIVVHPRNTALLQAARAAGATTVDGVGMLVHQAALAFTLWTGQEAPVAAMRAAAEAQLEAG
jgi:shikimate dehydrogenase